MGFQPVITKLFLQDSSIKHSYKKVMIQNDNRKWVPKQRHQKKCMLRDKDLFLTAMLMKVNKHHMEESPN